VKVDTKIQIAIDFLIWHIQKKQIAYMVKMIRIFTENTRKVCKQICQIWHVYDIFLAPKTPIQSVHEADGSVECICFVKM